MPNYTFYCEEDDTTIELTASIAGMEEWAAQNPKYKWVPQAGLPVLDSVRIGVKKPDDGFRDILKQVKRKNPRSNVNTF